MNATCLHGARFAATALALVLTLAGELAPVQAESDIPPDDPIVAQARANAQRAVESLRQAAEHGHAEAQRGLGQLYQVGFVVPQNYAQAAKWYRLAAGQGLAEAQYSLGVLYAAGLGVPRDPAEAAAWWRKAADQGHAKAEAALAETGNTDPDLSFQR